MDQEGLPTLRDCLKSVLEGLETTAAKFGSLTPEQQLQAVFEAQVQLAECMLVLGTVIQTTIADGLVVQVKPPKGVKEH